jgi:histidinol-phosphate aminotransferase
VKKLLRDCVSQIEQYQPGKPAEVLKKELALKKEICKLASNENPLGPSPLALTAIQKSLKESNLYPDNSCHLIKEKLAKHLHVPPDNLKVGNGSSELILLLGLAFLEPEDTMIMSQASFIFAKIVAQTMGCQLVEVPLNEYRHDLGAILQSVTPNTKIIYLDNPMNPIGSMTKHIEISDFLGRLPEDIVVVLDEAYHNYVSDGDFPESLTFIEEAKNVIVLRTFSKMYGLAGLRVGYGVAKKEFIHALDIVSPPFSVNKLGQIGAAVALDDRSHVQKTKEINEEGKRSLYRYFEKLDVFYIPSQTNFVTIDMKTDTLPFSDELQKRGVIVRPLSMYGLPTFLRVTIGTMEQNKRFMDSFGEIYKKSI